MGNQPHRKDIRLYSGSPVNFHCMVMGRIERVAAAEANGVAARSGFSVTVSGSIGHRVLFRSCFDGCW